VSVDELKNRLKDFNIVLTVKIVPSSRVDPNEVLVTERHKGMSINNVTVLGEGGSQGIAGLDCWIAQSGLQSILVDWIVIGNPVFAFQSKSKNKHFSYQETKNS
jgi:hypothetical protein